MSHYEGTGPEIWDQVASLESFDPVGLDVGLTPIRASVESPPLVKLDGFSCAVGTGGSLAGIGTYLREQSTKQVGWAL